MPHLALASGEKLRRGGQLEPEVSLPAGGASIPALRLPLPTPSPATRGLYLFPSSLLTFGYMVSCLLGEEPSDFFCQFTVRVSSCARGNAKAKRQQSELYVILRIRLSIFMDRCLVKIA
jgi:hypothetical protein